MRWVLLCLSLGLAACLPGAGDPLDPERPDAELGYVFDDAGAAVGATGPVEEAQAGAIAVAEADTDAVEEGDDALAEVAPSDVVEEAPPRTDLNAEARRRCARSGGRFTRSPAGLFFCVRETRDANKSCTADRDCQGVCLARSRTCAPLTPLLGCHQVFTATGIATVCVE